MMALMVSRVCFASYKIERATSWTCNGAQRLRIFSAGVDREFQWRTKYAICAWRFGSIYMQCQQNLMETEILPWDSGGY